MEAYDELALVYCDPTPNNGQEMLETTEMISKMSPLECPAIETLCSPQVSKQVKPLKGCIRGMYMCLTQFSNPHPSPPKCLEETVTIILKIQNNIESWNYLILFQGHNDKTTQLG